MSSDASDVSRGAPPVPPVAGRYVLEELLARGGMGAVYRARDEVLARPVAVKILHSHLSADESFLARFRREAVAAAGLAHPGIVAIYDTGSDVTGDGEQRHYIVMEHCSRGTLTDLARAESPLDPSRAAAIAAAVCDALDFAHGAGVVHRDVKPDNVLFSEDGALKVADFGIAKAAYASGDITTTGSILGTVTYISPEQAGGAEPSARSDIYSVGVLLYELLVGRPPFAAETDVGTALMHVKDSPTPVRALRPQVPRHLDGVVAKALAKDPMDRWASAGDMRRALQGAAHPVGATVPIDRPAPPAAHASPTSRSAEEAPSSDTRWIAPVLGLVAFAVLLAFLVPRLLDEPSGQQGQPGGGGPRGGGSVLRAEGVTSFDPDGDGTEHEDEADLAGDGNQETAWSSETYEDSLEILGKDGIGLVFDLGRAASVGEVEIATSTAGLGIEIRAGDGQPELEEDAELVGRPSPAASGYAFSFDPVTARYWLVWITSLPGDGGGTVSIEEVVFRGTS